MCLQHRWWVAPSWTLNFEGALPGSGGVESLLAAVLVAAPPRCHGPLCCPVSLGSDCVLDPSCLVHSDRTSGTLPLNPLLLM